MPTTGQPRRRNPLRLAHHHPLVPRLESPLISTFSFSPRRLVSAKHREDGSRTQAGQDFSLFQTLTLPDFRRTIAFNIEWLNTTSQPACLRWTLRSCRKTCSKPNSASNWKILAKGVTRELTFVMHQIWD